MVRFDPWLISNRDDLILSFFAELKAAMGSSHSEKARDIATKVAKYAESLTPAMGWLIKLADYDPSGIGDAIKSLASVAQKVLAEDHSLYRQRRELEEALDHIDFAIVVLVDELDRVEDAEVRTIAQLVRAIADFSSISYLLAYDQDRVIEALGSCASEADRMRRGRAYLEKIVHYQIGLPIAQEGDLSNLLYPELDRLSESELFPKEWREDARYSEVESLLIPAIVGTPRDIKRLIGAYRVLAPMVQGEVDYLDLLAFAALETKAPEVVAQVRRDPDRVLSGGLLGRRSVFNTGKEKETSRPSERLNEWMPGVSTPLVHLIGHIFPQFSDFGPLSGHPDPICESRALTAVLRLGLPSDRVSRDAVLGFLHSDVDSQEAQLLVFYEQGKLSDFIDRLKLVYPAVSPLKHNDLWRAVAHFLENPVMASDRGRTPDSFANALAEIVRQQPDQKGCSKKMVADQLNTRIVLTSAVLRHQVFANGMYGERQGDAYPWLTEDETVELIKRQSACCRREHLDGGWLLELKTLNPLFNMLALELWDEECRTRVDQIVQSDEELERFTAMLFGRGRSTGSETLVKIVNVERYLERLTQRLADPTVDANMRFACDKAAKSAASAVAPRASRESGNTTGPERAIAK